MKRFDRFIIVLILLNVLAVIIESVSSLHDNYSALFYYFEVLSVIIFSIEYLFRIVVCTDCHGNNPVLKRMRYTLTPMAMIDLFAILPFYLPLFFPIDLRFLRILRLIRITRLFKITRYSNSLKLIQNALYRKKEQLYITFFFGIIILIFCSCLMYVLEHTAQPDLFSSIPATMWWTVATLTTVGYGDIYPITTFGKIIGAFIAILGIGLFALPTGIIGSGLIEEIEDSKKQTRCPHCGKDI